MSMSPLEDLYGLASDADLDTLRRMYEHVLKQVPPAALNDLYWEILDIVDSNNVLDDEHDRFRDDIEADADVLANAGWGTAEDYRYYSDE